MEGSSAQKQGLHKGELVTEINGRSTKGMTAFDVIEMVMPDTSKTMTMKLQDAATQEARVVQLDRATAEVRDPVSYKLLDKTGYIRLAEFNALGPQKVREAVADLEAQGAERYIMDLRMNPGGTFQTALGIAGTFVPERTAVFVVDGKGERTEFKTSGKPLTSDPLIILADRGSASASEVLAGALQDNCRAVLVGDRTFGKGLIQGVFGLESGGGVALTVARYETPSGRDINKVGIAPDIKANLLPVFVGVSDVGEDTWDEAVRLEAAKVATSKLCE